MDHRFENKPLSRCLGCRKVLRRRASSGFFYASDINGPWKHRLDMVDGYATCDGAAEPEPMPEVDESLLDLWFERPIIMVDTETTGIDHSIDAVTEFGGAVARFHRREGSRFEVEILDSFCTLVRPQPASVNDEGFYDRLDECGRNITGITREHLENAPGFEVVADWLRDTFLRYGGRALPAAYNGLFDQNMLLSMHQRIGRVAPPEMRPPGEFIDACAWSRKLDRYVKGGHKLTTVAQRYNLLAEDDLGKAHRADFDCGLALRTMAALASRRVDNRREKPAHEVEAVVPLDIEDMLDWQRATAAEWALNFFGHYRRRERAAARIGMEEGSVVDD